MTCFAHVLPLSKIYHLIDSLLVGPDSPQIYLSFGILMQIRDSLLSGDFNSIMLLFSDLDVDVEDLIYTVFQVANCTPPSMLRHLYSGEFEYTCEDTSPRISLLDFKEMHSQSLLLDLRPRREFSSVHIKGSVSFVSGDINGLMVSLKFQTFNTPFIAVWISESSGSAQNIVEALIGANIKRVCVIMCSVNEVEDVMAKKLCSCLPLPSSLNIIKCRH